MDFAWPFSCFVPVACGCTDRAPCQRTTATPGRASSTLFEKICTEVGGNVTIQYLIAVALRHKNIPISQLFCTKPSGVKNYSLKIAWTGAGLLMGELVQDLLISIILISHIVCQWESCPNFHLSHTSELSNKPTLLFGEHSGSGCIPIHRVLETCPCFSDEAYHNDTIVFSPACY